MTTLPDAAAGAGSQFDAAAHLLLMVEDSHVEFLHRRFVQRPVSRQRAEGGGQPDQAKSPCQRKRDQVQAKMPNAVTTGGYGYAVDAGGIATVHIRGVMTPEAWAWYDDDETISEWVVRDLAAMTNDPAVRGAMFSIDSPGGYVAGSFELADAIGAFAAVKPTATFASGYCCSAAYLQAVQTAQITAYKTAIVGSIGTRSAVLDASKWAELKGFKVIPIDSGGMKSAGLLGTEITEEQIEYFRGTVLALQAHFTAAVARGRNFTAEKAQQMADGRVHVGSAAVALGLIDRVGGIEDSMVMLSEAIRTPTAGRAGKGKKMDESKPATLGELRHAFPDHVTFAADAFEAGLTMEKAKARFGDSVLSGTINPDGEKSGKTVGTKGLSEARGGSSHGFLGAIEQLEAAIAPLVAAGKPRHVARQQVLSSDDDLRERFIAEKQELSTAMQERRLRERQQLGH